MQSPRVFPEGEYFHICNKSIANFLIFRDYESNIRFLQTLNYYNNMTYKYSLSMHLKNIGPPSTEIFLMPTNPILKFIAYSIMPDHYHILIRILSSNALSKYISDVENSFSRYFNTRFKRKGPLWQSRFRAVRIKTNEQLLHVSRYIHLNATTSSLVENPEDWKFSSYSKYLEKDFLIKYMHDISISDKETYQRFVKDQKDYKKNLKRIKSLILE